MENLIILQASCTQIACNQASPGTQPQTIGTVPGMVPGAIQPGMAQPGLVQGGIVQGGIVQGGVPGQLPGNVIGKKK